ncbi:hypothetical protein [Pantoea sp. App145]|uniref:hypothetical protein n=1 Tax=Pantoea sp. App145 TaxID=3071567 RepID=UPI003A8131FD
MVTASRIKTDTVRSKIHYARHILHDKATVFQGYAGDLNELAILGAASLAASLSQKLNLPVSTIGTPAVIKGISSG